MSLEQDREFRIRYRCTSQDPHARSVRLFIASSGFAGRVHTSGSIERAFAPFGKVWDTRIGPSYGFVQYDNMDSAQRAVTTLNNTRLDHHLITVKLSTEGNAATPNQQPPQKMGNDASRPYNGPGLGAPLIRNTPYPPAGARPDYGNSNPMKREMPTMGNDIPPKRFQDAHHHPPGAAQPDHQYRPPIAAQPVYTPLAPGADLRPPYDCLLITGNEAQRAYCQSIEKLLIEKSQMLTCIQVVAGEAVLGKAVVEAAKKNIPYTISVNENNQHHRSITLNILHSSQPQEHRNMPLDDAIPFLGRSFDQFVETMKKKIAAVGEWVPPTQEMIQMLGKLMEGRQLSFNQMKKVERYVLLLKDKARTIDAITDPSLRTSPRSDSRDTRDSHRARSVERRREEPRDRRRDEREHRDHRDQNHRSMPRERPQETQSGLPPPRSNNGQPAGPSTGTLQDLVRARNTQQDTPNYTPNLQSQQIDRPTPNITLDDDLVRKALELVAQTNMKAQANNSGAHNPPKRSWYS